ATTRAQRTLVAWRRPPRPASTTAASTSAAANSARAAAVSTSNCVAPSRSAGSRTRSSASSRSASSWSTWIRSLQPATCGEVYAPTLRPSRRRNAAARRVAVDLPFVPTTWIAGNARCGSPSSARSARIRPRPNSSGQGERDSSHSSAEGIKLAPVPLQLLPLRLDHVRRRVRHEALVGEHPLGAGDLPAEPLALSLDVAVRLDASRAHDRLEDPPLVFPHLAERSAAAEDRREILNAVEGFRVRDETLVRLRPRSHDQPVVVELRPDLLGDVRDHRVQELEQQLQRRQRRRACILVPVVEARLDLLRVPVAEVVE